MKSIINIFTELGLTLKNNCYTEVYELANAENRWFTLSDIERSLDAICSIMLTHENLSRWINSYPSLPTQRAEQVLIIMAGNIPLVGFADLLSVLAAGHHAIVKPSHKDRVLTEWIISKLIEIEPSIPIYIYNERDTIDRVIATGGDAALLHFNSQFRDIPTLLRGSRHSIAIITNDTKEIPKELATDIYSYSGLGCRNVSLIFVPRGYDLSKIPTIPADKLNDKYINNYLQNRALLTISGTEFYDTQSSCMVYQDLFPICISTISIIEYDTIAEAEQWVTRNDNEIQCIVAEEDRIKHPRRVNFGEAQYPTLFDYADGVDTMIFLS